MNGTDADLISHYASTRDAESFAELVSRYRNMVYSAAVRVVREPATAEDVTQDCFLQLARSAASIKSSVAAWLHSVAVNVSIDLAQQHISRYGDHSKARRYRPCAIEAHIPRAFRSGRNGEIAYNSWSRCS